MVKSYTEIVYKVSENAGVIKKDYKGRWITYKFNELGNKSEVINYEPYNGHIRLYKKYNYDDKGKLLEINCFDGNGTLLTKHSFKHDSQGNDSLEIINNFQNNKTTIYKYTYDKNGNKLSMNGLNHIGIKFIFEQFKYDLKGNIIEELSFKPDDILSHKFIYKYDAENKLVEKRTFYYSIDSTENIYFYKYDLENNLIEEHYCNKDGQITVLSKYTFDKHLNWIKKLSFEFGVPISETERKIEYY